MQVESYQRESIEGTIGAAPPTPPWHSSPAHEVLLAVDGSASGIPGARMEALTPSPARALAGRGHLFMAARGGAAVHSERLRFPAAGVLGIDR